MGPEQLRMADPARGVRHAFQSEVGRAAEGINLGLAKMTGYLTAAEAEALVQAGKAASSTKWLEEAREILAEAVRAVRGEEDGYKRARAFADIAEAQAKAGDARGAALANDAPAASKQ